MRMRLVLQLGARVGGGTSAAIMTLVMVACAKGTDSTDLGEGGVDEAAVRDVFVIPDDSAKPDTGPGPDGGTDARVG